MLFAIAVLDRGDFVTWGHLAISGDDFRCYNWYLVDRDQGY